MFKNNLFIKICLSFWLTTLFMIGSVLMVDWLTQTGPFHLERHPLHGSPLAVHGFAYAWILEHEGLASLRDFAGQLENATGLPVHFFSQGGEELTGKTRATRSESRAISVLAAVKADPVNSVKEGRVAIKIQGADGRPYAVVAELPLPPERRRDPGIMVPLRLLVVLAVSGLICYVLARYLTAPILQLGTAARQLADGDLSARVGPRLGQRTDEISVLARDFDRMAEWIETLVVSQRTLLRDISHELRSPLARLNVALELCRRGNAEEITKSLNRIEKESGRLNEMVGQLLTLNRVEAGISGLGKKRIDLATLIVEIVADADFEAKGLNRGVQATVTEACIVEGDEDLLRRAIENVARNALHYTPEGTCVEVSLRCRHASEGLQGVIAVRDHGAGVPEAALSHLFQPFYRVDSGRQRETGGTGLGLAITETAIRRHGGVILATNAGGGLNVEITLPALSGPCEPV
jgi:two-component system sensor histidine kinase CpxA